MALALASLLVCGLVAPVAMARPNGPLHPQLAAAVPARPGNEPGRTAPDRPPWTLDAPAASAPLTAAAMGAGYVDPAGGHLPVRPIETSNPYQGP